MTHSPIPEKLGGDPDETEGRALYRQIADAKSAAQLALARRRVGLERPTTPPNQTGERR